MLAGPCLDWSLMWSQPCKGSEATYGLVIQAEVFCINQLLIVSILLILGTVKESGAKHKGLIEIPSLSEENEVNDTEVSAGALLFSG